MNDLLCARIAGKLIIFFADIFVQGIAKELNYKMVGVSKVTGDQNCPGNRKKTEKSRNSQKYNGSKYFYRVNRTYQFSAPPTHFRSKPDVDGFLPIEGKYRLTKIP